jgi:glucokinase
MLAEISVPTWDFGGKAWLENVDQAHAQLTAQVKERPSCIGIAAPGLAARDQRSIAVMPGRLRGLEGFIWERHFTGQHRVLVMNDAHAALMGEAWRGAARHSTNVILLTLGTGVGGAAIVDGRLLRGHLGRAGHFGHVSLNPAGAPDITSTPGSLEDAIGDWTIKVRTNGRFSSTEELVAAYRHHDKLAEKVWLTSVRALAAALCSLINVLDPELIVIGGGIARAGKALFQPLRQMLAQFEWRPGGSRVKIVPAKLGNRAGAFGAAWNVLQQKPV